MMSTPEFAKASTVAKGLEVGPRTDTLNLMLKKITSSESVFVKEMESVAGDVLTVKKEYLHVQSKLEETVNSYDDLIRSILFNQTFKTKQKAPNELLDLLKSWKRHCKNFDLYLQASLESAKRSRDFLGELSRDVFPYIVDENNSTKERKSRIRSYIEKLNSEKKKSEKLQTTWSSTGVTLYAASANWTSVINEIKFNKAVSPYPVDRCAEIITIQKNIDGIHRNFKNYINDIHQYSDGASTFINTFCPLALSEVALEALPTHEVQFNSTLAIRLVEQKKIATHKDTHIKALEKANFITHTDTIVKFPDVLLPTALEKISTFSSLWLAIRNDLRFIEKKLDTSISSVEDKKLATVKLEVTHKLYEILHAGFDKYCAAMDAQSSNGTIPA